MPEFGVVRTFLLSLLPGLFWVTYLRSLSSGKVCAWWTWCIALGAGWASTQLVSPLSEALHIDELNRVPYVGSLVFFIFGVGLIEEGAKAFCTLVGLKIPGLLDQPLFALQLSGGVALGFATTENMLYASAYGDGVLVVRFVFSTLGHILFSALWGFALGSRLIVDRTTGTLKKRTDWKNFALFLSVSAFAHGLFDWFLTSDRPALAVVTLIVLWIGFREAVVGAYLGQEYSRELPYETLPCEQCSALTRTRAQYCSHCGQPISVLDEKLPI